MVQDALRFGAVLIAAVLLGLPARAQVEWPSKVVTFEALSPLTKLQLRVPRLVVEGAVRGPSILRVHIDATGKVVRQALYESCGNADLDEAALHAMREMRFEPYLIDGSAAAVTLVVPVHVPKRYGNSPR